MDSDLAITRYVKHYFSDIGHFLCTLQLEKVHVGSATWSNQVELLEWR